MSVVASKPHPLLARYLAQLQQNPLRTKMLTSGSLSFIQEILANHLARVPMKSKSSSTTSQALAATKVDSKAVKMAVYGSMVSAPLGHFLVGLLQKIFAGRSSKTARFAQVIASNVFIAPIQAAVYLSSISVINGARDLDTIVRVVRSRFFAVLRISWITSPVAIIVAQNFLPPELWVPWFNLVTFIMGTYLNTQVKKSQLAAAKAEKRG